MRLAVRLLSVLLALATALLALLVMAVTLIVRLSHAKGDLLDALAGNSHASRSVALLVGDGEDQIALVGVSVPGFDPGGLVLGVADGADSGENVAGVDLCGDHVVLVAGLDVLGPASVLANNLELRPTILR